MAAPLYEIRVATKRYFDNPCINSASSVSNSVDEQWLFEKISSLANRICSRQIQPEEFEKGLLLFIILRNKLLTTDRYSVLAKCQNKSRIKSFAIKAYWHEQKEL
jgi:hypothetical protein